RSRSRRARRRAHGVVRYRARAPVRRLRRHAGTARPPTLLRGMRRRRADRSPPRRTWSAGWLLAYAQHPSVLPDLPKVARSTSPLGEPRSTKHTRRAGGVKRKLCAEAAEDGERVFGQRLPHHFAAGFHAAVEALREPLGILLRGRPDDQVLGLAHGPVPLVLELPGERLRGVARAASHADLPRCVAVLDLLLFPRLALRLVVPAVLVVEPVL